jgi:hypothetical protein
VPSRKRSRASNRSCASIWRKPKRWEPRSYATMQQATRSKSFNLRILQSLQPRAALTKVSPQFEARFGRLMLALRDELMLIEGDTVRLVVDYEAHLASVLISSLKA